MPGVTKGTENETCSPRRVPNPQPVATTTESPPRKQSKLGQLRLLLWKNMLLRKRHWFLTLLELFVPTALMCLIVFLRTINGSKLVPDIHSTETIFKPMAEDGLRKMFCHKSMGTWSTRLERCIYIDSAGPGNRKLFWGPPNPFTKEMIKHISKEIFFKDKYLFNVSSIQEMNDLVKVSYLESEFSLDSFYIGIYFNLEDAETTKPPLHLNYDLRLQKIWMTEFIYPFLQIPGPRNFTGNIVASYNQEGFTLLQTIVDRTYMKLISNRGDVVDNVTLEVQMYPYPPYIQDHGLSQFYGMVLPTFVVFSLVLLSPTLIKSIVYEKETGVRELMRMMGLDGWLLWVGWFFYSFTSILLICLILTVMLKVQVVSHDGTNAVLPALVAYSDGTLLFVCLLLYGISAICFCFAISCFFNKPIIATTIGVILWLLSYYIPRTFVGTNYTEISLTGKLLTCILPNMAMTLLFKVLGLLEGRAVGLHWNNLWDTGSAKDPLAPAMILIMLVIDIFLYIFITWYVDQVFPGKYGVGRPWYFMFQKMNYKKRGTVLDHSAGSLSSTGATLDSYTEAEPDGLVPGIKIRGLRKIFKTRKNMKVAVDHVDLTCFKGQCTVLLGHNGAGKTTTMCVLTGTYPPTRGSAEINGWNIKTHLKEARAQLGLCPQHNTLFTDLTVREHLIFFARLKGLTIRNAKAEADFFLWRLKLEDKANHFGGALSGGMKRKLCLSIALIGGSKVLILDEPSSGLDPESRRWVWDVVQQERSSRTVLVTTHHMEEADVLGDRVAIMANGRVVRSGSSFFLKNVFGDGYTLSITGQQGTNLPKIESVITSYFSEASLRSVDGFHYDFKLPPETAKFPKLLSHLTERKEALKIDHLGLSLTTMEQVFLKVGEMEDKRKNPVQPIGGVLNASFEPETTDISKTLPSPTTSQNWDLESNYRSETSTGSYREFKLSGTALLFQRFRSMWTKKFIYSKRKWILILTQALLPVAVTVMALVLSSIFISGDMTEDPRLLKLSMFDRSYSFVECHEENLTDIMDNYMNQFHGPYQVSEVNDTIPALLDVSEVDITLYREHHVTSAIFREDSGQVVTRMMYQSIPYHTPGVGINLIDNAIMNTFVDKAHRITTRNSPLPLNTAWKMDDDPTTYGSSFFAMVMPLPLAFLTSSFLVFPLQERVSKSKQIQLMTGTSASLLWSVSFLWDIITYTATAILIFICFVVLDSHGYFMVDGAPGALFLLLFLYGFGSIPMAYVFSFLFESPASGFSVLALINIIAGMIISTATLTLQYAGTETLIWISDIIGNITAFIPSYPASKGFMSIVDVTNYNSFCDTVAPEDREELCEQLHRFVQNSTYMKCCDLYCEDYGECFEKLNYLQWQYPGLGMHLMYLAMDFFFYLLILYLFEIGVGKLAVIKTWEVWRKIFPVAITESSLYVDEDVAREGQIVNNLMNEKNLHGTAIVVQNLRKVFTKSGLVAVKGISFHVQKGECFGLLGVNGAGKTTTFRMLTGDEVRSSGDARIGDYYLSQGRKQFMEEIGYCPQFDAIIDELTGEEMLSLMAGLRGIASERHSELLERLIYLVDLTECAQRTCGTYSGGNKRKLSTAMALVGQPPLVFLDEPTSGVDPASRRRVWEAVRDATLCGQSVILTSHSMDECEALCSNIVIMAKGVLRCKGTSKHLKVKFGKGYTLQIKIKSLLPQQSTRDDLLHYKKTVVALKEVIILCFKGAVITDEHREMIAFHIPSTVSWSQIFNVMEALKTGNEGTPDGVCDTLWKTNVRDNQFELLIEDYAAMDTSLEQVFLSFAREQEQSSIEVLMETKL